MSGLLSEMSVDELERLRADAQADVDSQSLHASLGESDNAIHHDLNIEHLEKAKQSRLKQAKNDFAFFCKTYMPEAFSLDFSPYQLALARLASSRKLNFADEQLFRELIDPMDHKFIKQPYTGTYDGILDIEPRDHGKTTRNTQAMPLWLTLNHPNIFVVVCGASETSAVEMMDAIKLELEDNQSIIDDYGIQKVHGNTWKKQKVVLPTGNAIVARGRGQRLRGIKNKFRRPTHIICDDLLEDTEVESERLRNQAERWFKRVVLNLGKDALTIITNTIMHKDDLPSRLLNQISEGVLPNWLGLRFSAITPKGDSLFPARWTLQELEVKRITVGKEWWTEWMNRPQDDEDALFIEEWFTYFNPHDLDLRDCDIGMAVDPATGTKKGDGSAIVVLARHRITQVDHVLFAKKWQESDLVFAQRVVDVYVQFSPSFVMFEEVAFQKIYKQSVMRYAKKKHVNLPIKGFRGGNKYIRIKSLSSQVENGFIQFLTSQLMLKQQLLEYPNGHDDLPDALEMCQQGFKQSGFVGCARIIKKSATSTASKIARSIGRGAMRGGRW